MSESHYRTKRESNRRPLIIVGVVAAVLIVVVLLISGGPDDPVVNDLVPPVDSTQIGTTDASFGTDPEYTGPPAIDGAPVEGEPEPDTTGPYEDHADHDHETAEPEAAATDIGPFIETAERFAELNINRPTDTGGSLALNKKLVELSAGNLARDLASGNGEIQTAQVSSEGEVLQALPITKEGNYAEVLIVTRESVVDQATGTTLDPNYLTYIVRLEEVTKGRFAVTSWEPQI